MERKVACKKKVPLEKSVVAATLKYLNSLPSCFAIKTHGSRYTAGWPDIFATIDGRTLVLEVKRPGNNQATPLQQAVLKKWNKAGAITGIVHSVEEVKELLAKEKEMGNRCLKQ